MQLDSEKRLRHLLSIEGLPRETLLDLLDTTDSFLSVEKQSIKKVPLLRGKTVMNLFFESSTRTRTTFEVAAKRLSADVLNLDIAESATKKGETLLDTIHNLQAMHCDLFIVRHRESGAAEFVARHIAPHVAVINAGDGCHAHPSQALLDMYTIRHNKGEFNKLSVAIVGDILHSRVARSQIYALHTLGIKELRVIAPKTLLPKAIDSFGAQVFHDFDRGLENVDVIIMLRLQEERMSKGLLPSKEEYFHQYGLTEKRLAKANSGALVMHPGPINRGVEIASSVADGAQSVILQQVHFGIAVRMAIMAKLTGNIAAQQATTQTQVKAETNE